MTLDAALSLTDFINERKTRFHANVLDFGSQGWVIVADRHADRYLEPIADPGDYVRRAGIGVVEVDVACRDLIHEWVTKRYQETEAVV